ncbi:type II toxin-antitoxin system RelE/ParE family toxin [Epilithonimonas sp. UC225_85]|uniref:type II toxin-antitoxin system RelE/ParE family toxin n=1 Tax=Epilithonimonas sp. UC225_85 TaxID=3350167 RepID=UPI0036D30A0A
MGKYFLSNKAVEDLENIYEYTFNFWSESQADKYYLEIIDFCQMLADSPKIGKAYPEIDPEISGFIANRHLIFFRILNLNEIEVIRILGAEMDLKNRIQE